MKLTRMDIIGLNGNTGEHYEKLPDVVFTNGMIRNSAGRYFVIPKDAGYFIDQGINGLLFYRKIGTSLRIWSIGDHWTPVNVKPELLVKIPS